MFCHDENIFTFQNGNRREVEVRNFDGHMVKPSLGDWCYGGR